MLGVEVLNVFFCYVSSCLEELGPPHVAASGTALGVWPSSVECGDFDLGPSGGLALVQGPAEARLPVRGRGCHRSAWGHHFPGLIPPRPLRPLVCPSFQEFSILRSFLRPTPPPPSTPRGALCRLA